MTSLLVIGDSIAQRAVGDAGAPTEVFDSPVWRLLRQQSQVLENVYVALVSVKYGLVWPGFTVDNYEATWTAENARDWAPIVSREFKKLLYKLDQPRTLIVVNAVQLVTLGDVSNIKNVEVASGALGVKLQTLIKWLQAT